VVGKYFAATIPFLLLAIWLIQRYYLRTSRQVRLLDIEAKSPLYTHFSETIAGISTVKAYRWQNRFQQTCDEHINNAQRPYYTLLSIQEWLACILDLVVAVMAVILVSITTFFSTKFTPAEIGVGLNLVLTFNSALAQAITSWTQLETSMGAVDRVQQFRDTTPSEHRPWGRPAPPHDWPNQGVILFDRVTACHGFASLFPASFQSRHGVFLVGSTDHITYSSNMPAALTNVSLTIKSNEKFAICGPSGSGKTSLILTLLQMIDVQSGSVSIDGIDLQSLQPSDVRSRINVIPQDPFFFPGTVRHNLSPTATTPDTMIESALQRVGLWEKISRNGGLGANLQPTSWSAGEKQLLALARSLASDSQIVILDEATSS
jgi:ABC-type multidrug transport system fused ATPase/permease subunit